MLLKVKSKMLIKTLALVFIIHCALVATDDVKFSPKEASAKCREANHLEQEEIMQLNRTRHIETNDERIKCFLKCYLMELKLMDENGELTLDENLDRKMKYKKHHATCKNVTGTDACDKATNFHNCMWEQLDKEEQTPI